MKPSFISLSAQRACTVFAATLALTGCGGNGSDSPPTTQPARGELLLAGISYSSNNAAGNTLLIVAADKPTVPRLSVNVDDHLAATGLAIDPATRTYTFLGDSMVYFVKSGQLFQVSLHKEDSTVAQRISSLTTACTVDDWHPLKLDGSDDAWVQVSEAGPDGDCTQEADNRSLFVRTGTPATTAATALPTGVEMLTPLPDLSLGALGFFLALDQRATPKLTLYSATWASLGDVAGGEGLSELEVLGFLPGPTLGSSAYARSGASLRRLTWSTAGASLSAPLYTFASASATSDDAPYLVDDVAMYFMDGLSVLRINAAGTVSPLSSLNPALGNQAFLAYAMTSSHLVLQQQHANDDNSSSLHTLLKTGGAPVPLAAGASAAKAYAIHGEDLIYLSTTGSRSTLRRIHLHGSNDRFIADLGTGYAIPIPVYSANFITFSGFRLDAITWCEAASSTTNCHNGSLKSLDLSTGISTTLGSFSHAGTMSSWFAYAGGLPVTGQPMVVQTYAFDSTNSSTYIDMYVARPNTASSLVRVSTNTP